MPALMLHELRCLAFGEGSDARLAGYGLEYNPYPASHDGSAQATLHRLWNEGWWCVHREWGRYARWPVRRLPPVRREEATA